MRPNAILKMLHRALKRTGLPKIRFHDLCHTFAAPALQNGVDVKTLSELPDTTPQASRRIPMLMQISPM